MKVIISDSTGYVGDAIRRQLKKKSAEIVVLDNLNGFDLSVPGIWEKIPPADYFIHLGNLVHVPSSYATPYLYYRVNYMTTLNALEYCRNNSCRLIYASSYIYGRPDYLPVDENHPIKPFNPYAQTKLICEQMCEGYNRDFDVDISILRLFNVYGEGQRGNLLVPEILRQIKDGNTDIHLKSGFSRRDFIHVVDVARAFVACFHDDSSYSVYNVCSGKSYSILELSVIINKVLANRLNFIFSESDRKYEVDDTVGSYERIYSHLKWKPELSLEEGIARTLKAELCLK